MLWLIWIAIMLITPILAGITVWWETRTSVEPVIADIAGDQLQA